MEGGVENESINREENDREKSNSIMGVMNHRNDGKMKLRERHGAMKREFYKLMLNGIM